MKVVVTGATSFIAKRFVYAATEKGWNVVAVVRRNSKKICEFSAIDNLVIVEMNMDEYSQLGEMVGSCDVFAHFSWNGTRGQDRLDYVMQEENYINSVEAIKSMIHVGCKRIITAGSQAEYGPCDGIISEETLCCPNTPYGIYKLKLFYKTKKLCELNDVLFIEPRFFSLYGPGDFEKTLIMSMIHNMKNNKPCDLTQCIQMWDFLYIDDAIDAIIEFCKRDCVGGVYNLGSGDTRELKSYIEELKSILNSTSTLNYGIIPYPTTGKVSICPSIKKIKRELGWKAKTTFSQGICNIIVNSHEN